MKDQNTFDPASAEVESSPVASLPADALLQSGVVVSADAAGGELFTIPETKSPRLRWMEKHVVWTKKTAPEIYEDPEHAWKAEAAGYSGFGQTEDEATVNLAKKLRIPLWNEEGA